MSATFPNQNHLSRQNCGWLRMVLLGSIVLAGAVAQGWAQANFYWDLNSSSGGSGAIPSGVWDTTSFNWNNKSGGGSAPEVFVSGSNAIFSAGTTASNSYTVTVSGTQNTSGITIQDGTPMFTGGTLNFNDATPTLVINTGRTLDWGSTLLTSATNILNKSGSGTLNFTENLTFGGTVNYSGGTLQLSNANLTLGTLNITGNTVIDFAGSASILNLTNFSISSGVTLTVQNWSAATDFFYTANWAGAALDTAGSAPMNRITFTGFTANQTNWSSFDKQIRPNVPEPATYGALLLGSLTGLIAWRRRRS